MYCDKKNIVNALLSKTCSSCIIMYLLLLCHSSIDLSTTIHCRIITSLQVIVGKLVVNHHYCKHARDGLDKNTYVPSTLRRSVSPSPWGMLTYTSPWAWRATTSTSIAITPSYTSSTLTHTTALLLAHSWHDFWLTVWWVWVKCGPADLRTDGRVNCGPKVANRKCGPVGKMRTLMLWTCVCGPN